LNNRWIGRTWQSINIKKEVRWQHTREEVHLTQLERRSFDWFDKCWVENTDADRDTTDDRELI